MRWINFTASGMTSTVGESSVILMRRTRRRLETNGKEGRLIRSTRLKERKRRQMRQRESESWWTMPTTVIQELSDSGKRKRMKSWQRKRQKQIKLRQGKMKKNESEKNMKRRKGKNEKH